MTLNAVQQSESEAMIDRLVALDDDTQRQRLVTENASLDWDAIVNMLAERVWYEVRSTRRAPNATPIALSPSRRRPAIICRWARVIVQRQMRFMPSISMPQPLRLITAQHKSSRRLEIKANSLEP
jgi:hypothetical protein